MLQVDSLIPFEFCPIHYETPAPGPPGGRLCLRRRRWSRGRDHPRRSDSLCLEAGSRLKNNWFDLVHICFIKCSTFYHRNTSNGSYCSKVRPITCKITKSFRMPTRIHCFECPPVRRCLRGKWRCNHAPGLESILAKEQCWINRTRWLLPGWKYSCRVLSFHTKFPPVSTDPIPIINVNCAYYGTTMAVFASFYRWSWTTCTSLTNWTLAAFLATATRPPTSTRCQHIAQARAGTGTATPTMLAESGELPWLPMPSF